MLRVDKTRRVVARYSEIVALMGGFALLLVLLFPKDFLYKQVLRETSNYDLTVAYLNNMIKRDPHNTHLLLALAKAAYREGNTDLGLTILGALYKHGDASLKREAEKLTYALLEKRLGYVSHNDVARKIKARMAETVRRAADNVTDANEAAWWYVRARSLGLDDAALRLAQKVVRRRPDDALWLRRVYRLAGKTGDRALRNEMLEALVRYDTKRRMRWLRLAYDAALKAGDTQKQRRYAEEIERSDGVDYAALAKSASAAGRYDDAARYLHKQYMRDKQTAWLFEAMDMLSAQERRDEAVAFAKAHEEAFWPNLADLRRLLRFYLREGYVSEASRVAKRLLDEAAP